MSKQSFYFSHDYDARTDEKMVILRYRHHAAGYGIFWMLVEKMGQSADHYLKNDAAMLAYDLQDDKNLIEKVIKTGLEIKLFISRGDYFSAPRLLAHIEKRKEVSKQRSVAGKASAKQRLIKRSTNVEQNLTSAQQNSTKKGKERKGKEIKEEKGAQIVAFAPPSLDEAQSYCKERQNKVDPWAWHNFYASKGWMVGKNKMRDWKAAIRTWEGREGGGPPSDPLKPSNRCQRPNCGLNSNFVKGLSKDGKTKLCKTCLNDELVAAEQGA